MDNNIKDILENFPFMTLGQYQEEEYLGIIANADQQLVSMYVYDNSLTADAKKIFLDLGDKWWWETNRKIPINIVLRQEWMPFSKCLKLFSAKDFQIMQGPTLSIQDLAAKRIKRRQIHLVAKVT